MAFCTKCGKQIPENTRFCPYCGSAAGEGQPSYQQRPITPPATDHTAEYDSNDIKEHRAISVLSYLGPLFFVPLVATPNSKFARFHANQGLILFAIELVYGFLYSFLSNFIASFLITGISTSTYKLIMLPFELVWIFPLVLTIIGIVNASKGFAKEIPCFGKFRFFK